MGNTTTTSTITMKQAPQSELTETSTPPSHATTTPTAILWDGIWVAIRRNDIAALKVGLRNMAGSSTPSPRIIHSEDDKTWLLGDPLVMAAGLGYLDCVKIIVDHVGGHITIKQYGAFVAAREGDHLDVADYLLAAGVRASK